MHNTHTVESKEHVRRKLWCGLKVWMTAAMLPSVSSEQFHKKRFQE
ncbi:hypothetical protein E2C01_083614 [Portunus trituberculatus]|uniref:Uncharacterized protein n=1 Tax=Portunus trituberculatus TaxID=210409 RepID=A0A5B7J1Q9_PORTR|nr:hypothetical protein [Portunus trituberculatus]